MVRGKSAAQAMNMLTFLPKKATGPLGQLLESALANAKNNFNMEREGLIIKEIRIDTGVTMKRSMPRARGTAYPINKRTSNVILVLAPVDPNAKLTKKAKYKAAKAKK
jgi:large subunit ribosomal protein L22